MLYIYLFLLKFWRAYQPNCLFSLSMVWIFVYHYTGTKDYAFGWRAVMWIVYYDVNRIMATTSEASYISMFYFSSAWKKEGKSV